MIKEKEIVFIKELGKLRAIYKDDIWEDRGNKVLIESSLLPGVPATAFSAFPTEATKKRLIARLKAGEN